MKINEDIVLKNNYKIEDIPFIERIDVNFDNSSFYGNVYKIGKMIFVNISIDGTVFKPNWWTNYPLCTIPNNLSNGTYAAPIVNQENGWCGDINIDLNSNTVYFNTRGVDFSKLTNSWWRGQLIYFIK